MTLKKYDFSITLDSDSGELTSLKYLKNEILYQGDQNWKKTYPICFPNLSFSRKYKYEERFFQLPKHGFWSQLDWNVKKINSRKLSAKARINHNNFPFQLDIEHTVSILPETIIQKIEIRNIGLKAAYFHLGLHPAFKIRDESFLFFSNDHFGHWISSKAALTKKEVILNEKTFVRNLDFKNPENDTIFIERWKRGNLALENSDYVVWLSFRSPNLQLWKHPEDDFICIEPWWGFQDDLYEYIGDVKKKKGIITLMPKKVFKAKLKIKVYNTNPVQDVVTKKIVDKN